MNKLLKVYEPQPLDGNEIASATEQFGVRTQGGKAGKAVSAVAVTAIATIPVVIITIIQEFVCYPPNDFPEFSKPELMEPVSKFLCS